MALPMSRKCSKLLSSFRRYFLPVTCSYCTEHRQNVRVRFAPSPTGLLHLGGLRTALYNYLFARSHAGSFVLRIEDTDRARLVPGAVERLEEMLAWAGLAPDEGPSAGGRYGPYLQSERLDLYTEMVDHLLQNGSGYRCFCTPKRLELLRKDAARRGEVYRYDNKCRHLTRTETEEKLARNTPSVVRFKLDNCTDPWEDLVYGPIVYDVAALEGDPIILKSDGFPTYHLANVVDDHYMQMSHVLRGEEWQVSTAKHILMYRAFGWTPPKFAHLPLMLNKDGTKLSKRQGDIHVEQFKNKGYYPEAVLNFITHIGGGFTHSGTDQGGFTLNQLVERFTLETLRSHSAKIDLDEIGHYNRLHLQKMLLSDRRTDVIRDTRSLIRNRLGQKLLADGEAQAAVLGDDYISRVLDWAVCRIHRLDELVEPRFEFVWVVPVLDSSETHQYGNAAILPKVNDVIQSLEGVSDHQATTKALRTFSSEAGIKFTALMKYLRKVLSGLDEGPSVAEIISVLGKEGTLLRLKHLEKKHFMTCSVKQ